MITLQRVLAIDLGLHMGLAAFDIDNITRTESLLWFRSRHVAGIAELKRLVAPVLDEAAGDGRLDVVVVEGDPRYADVWRKLTDKRGIAMVRVAPEVWRASLLLPREQRTGLDAKAHAQHIATDCIARGRAAKPRTPINDDAAEAIAIGVWFARYGARPTPAPASTDR
jgi:hypothetical protein